MNNTKMIENDFCITFSTINGSGSATANITLMRTLFRMGIPVSGKNIFPSNIQGQPTWFTLRLSKQGYLGRVKEDDIVVAMNPATLEKDISCLVPDGVMLVPDDFTLPTVREDIILYKMPVRKILKEANVVPALREYIANMVYVGVLCSILKIEINLIQESLNYHFKGNEKAVESNFSVVKMAFDWAEANLQKMDRYVTAKMNGTEGYIMTDGNTAAALGAIFGGVQFISWYPITPATSLAETLHEYLPQLRKDPETGKDTFAIVQAEDELAAIGMVIGAGWGGLRAMTSTSGPGLSLMTEYIGLAYYAEVPVVVWDVQRVGPSTGMPTRTSQGDLTMVNFMSHGDSQMLILIPGTIQECFEFGWRAFDIAERFQTPVIVLSDLDFGMNQWMTKKFEYPDQPIDRGKILWEEDLEKLLQRTGDNWGRYLDLDGDGIPYRTLPGNQHPKSGHFVRGTSHDEYANYTEDGDVWLRNFGRIKKKIDLARESLPVPVVDTMADAEIGIIASGSVDSAVIEARDLLLEEGKATDYLRIRGIPFSEEVKKFIDQHRVTYVVEVNRDGQLSQLLTMDFPEVAFKLRKVAQMDGLPLPAKWIVDEIKSYEEKK
ncbi:MAG TPA: 2-oxoacid:acceptor oxidoreductase subunit alpha [Anaerolineaceae bacterium]|nr:2-oxoacid:acceptor oxidoreductase subunit alpha [Anaerolineaceae bacterium]HOV05839.1 2-oxoacid:acceptor oxidoreductase subunit alpha [Anaerolineaceae bacterium]